MGCNFEKSKEFVECSKVFLLQYIYSLPYKIVVSLEILIKKLCTSQNTMKSPGKLKGLWSHVLNDQK